ncbi:PTS lactose/cellobiose transporter subunit IIA [Alkaliphilus sp. MSJ-5]|uniref:PTS lactose/cellobiose transporter subunit IIA n=1 Tax=Alkaliphilus flagellatus TaxID=2841507 RepID=A0ABS6FXN7_9FIRM|nr:PTS lactose/cellobiose transporter subunit IIA [Alkaliphilus flagellatus]MBU5674991.1 PTS lactose/cellobiose transporter subunit IIA [Alkaliphilus flagellatus]
MNYEELIFKLITQSGDAKSFAMEAIQLAKNRDFDKARDCLNNASKQLELAHRQQTELIHMEAQGNKIEVTLLLIHAQDHLMNAITTKDLASEIVDLYLDRK